MFDAAGISVQDAGDGTRVYRIKTAPNKSITLIIDADGELYSVGKGCPDTLVEGWPAAKYGPLAPIAAPEAAALDECPI